MEAEQQGHINSTANKELKSQTVITLQQVVRKPLSDNLIDNKLYFNLQLK